MYLTNLVIAPFMVELPTEFSVSVEPYLKLWKLLGLFAVLFICVIMSCNIVKLLLSMFLFLTWPKYQMRKKISLLYLISWDTITRKFIHNRNGLLLYGSKITKIKQTHNIYWKRQNFKSSWKILIEIFSPFYSLS